jgi:cytochrome c biogenesis protein CcdA
METVTILTAFAAGLISFLSPCVLPLVPGYISIISGFSLDQLKIETRRPSTLRAVFGNSLMFIIGFSITFISLGASASWLGRILLSKMTLLYKLAGVIIIIFGLHLDIVEPILGVHDFDGHRRIGGQVFALLARARGTDLENIAIPYDENRCDLNTAVWHQSTGMANRPLFENVVKLFRNHGHSSW